MCQFPRKIVSSLPCYENGIMSRRLLQIEVPCGHCLECLMNRSKEWSFRLEQEMKDWQNCAFITLTYDDSNLPVFSNDTGRVVFGRHNNGLSTLYKRDVTLFLKRLRLKKYGIIRFKYFAIGEYGYNGTQRPHYHIILFYNGCSPEKLYTTISQVWNKGRITCSRATPGRLSYCAKYACNMSVGFSARFQCPYMVCSRRTPIGYSWLSSPLAFVCAKRGQKCIKRSFIDRNGQRITYDFRIPRFYLRHMDLTMSYQELSELYSRKSYEKNFSPSLEPTTIICDGQLRVTERYYKKCFESYSNLVRSHENRDVEQHIKFPFSKWLTSFHQFELTAQNVRRSLSPIQRYSQLHKVV